jgi:hypothetical protein
VNGIGRIDCIELVVSVASLLILCAVSIIEGYRPRHKSSQIEPHP